MTFHSNITKRQMKRNTKTGQVLHTRYILHYRDPVSGKRAQQFFDKLRDAQAAQGELTVNTDKGIFASKGEVPTVEDAFNHFIEARRGDIKDHTLSKYEASRPYICGPLLDGTPYERKAYSVSGQLPPGAQFMPMLGKIKINDLSTAQIRVWHKMLMNKVGHRTGNKCRQILGTVLGLAAEDFDVRAPMMPIRLGRGKPKEKKLIFNPEQVAKVIRHAIADKLYGIYYAFPFLAGTRPSEQLGLLWEDVDLEKRVIHIRRMQEINGNICNITKTVAGNRMIPICSTLHEMIMDWKERCPSYDGHPHRVFPNVGHHAYTLDKRTHGGKVLLYSNFRTRIWKKGLEDVGVPYVGPHTARHSFISILQSEGVEVGLVAKLVGHANIVVTLNHYTQAVRGGEEAVEKLARAFMPAKCDVPMAGVHSHPQGGL